MEIQHKSTQSVASPRRVQMAYIHQNKLPPLDYTSILLGKEVNHVFTYISRCFCIFNELWPFTLDLHTQKSSLGCVLIPCTFISNFIKIRQTLLWKLSNGNQIRILMSSDLWPTYSEIELSCVLIPWTFISNIIKIRQTLLKISIGNQMCIFRIFNELWPLTFDLRTPQSNLACFLISCTFISNFIKIRQTLLKLSIGNQMCIFLHI